MKRTPGVDRSTLLLALPLGAVLIAGCAGRKPVAELARADQAIHHAQTTSQAGIQAPAELASAQAKLASARRAMAAGDYADARDLADQARAYAELAEEKSESQGVLVPASRTLSEVEVLRSETATEPDTVVVERRTVTRTAPPTAVIDRPAATAVHDPAQPVEVVVERPWPGRGAVSHDRAVIVVPE